MQCVAKTTIPGRARDRPSGKREVDFFGQTFGRLSNIFISPPSSPRVDLVGFGLVFLGGGWEGDVDTAWAE